MSNFNFNGLDGTYGTGYNTYNQYNTQYGQTQLPPLVTNKLFVNSLEDAMGRQVPPNSDAVYFDRNKDLLYNIITDAWNNKTYVVVELKKVESSITNQNKLEEEIAKLKETLNTLLNKEVSNG
jgi:hypothetical protein